MTSSATRATRSLRPRSGAPARSAKCRLAAALEANTAALEARNASADIEQNGPRE